MRDTTAHARAEARAHDAGSAPAGAAPTLRDLFARGTWRDPALVYPTLLAVVGDVAHPAWRGSAVGVYRLWRDLGYAVGAVLAGVLADAFGMGAAIGVVAAVTAAAGVVVAARLPETLRAATRG